MAEMAFNAPTAPRRVVGRGHTCGEWGVPYLVNMTPFGTPKGSRVEEWGCETPLMLGDADNNSRTVSYTSSNRIRRHRQTAQNGRFITTTSRKWFAVLSSLLSEIVHGPG